MRTSSFLANTALALALTSTLALSLALTSSGCTRWGVDGDDEVADDETETTETTETDTTETETDDGYAWPLEWEIDPDARVVVWGKSGIPTKNPQMLANLFAFLGEGGGDPMTILWIGDCDPRTDQLGCLLGNVQAFFDVVNPFATVEFNLLSQVDPLAYDVVVADFCGLVTAEQVFELLIDGAHVLVLADPWCETDDGTGIDKANAALERLGTRFTDQVLYNHEFQVASNKQVGILDGVPVLDAWGVALQEVREEDDGPFFDELVGTFDGALLTSRDDG